MPNQAARPSSEVDLPIADRRLPGASAQYANVQRKLQSLDRTINQIVNMPGLAPELVDRVEELRADSDEIRQQIAPIWNSINQPITDANNKVADLQGQEQTLEQEVARAAAVFNRANGQLESVRPHPDTTRRAAAEEALKTATAELDGIKVKRESLRTNLAAAKADAERAKGALKPVLDAPDGRLDESRRKLDVLVERASALHRQATENRSLAETGTLVEVSRDEFVEGRKYHRVQGKWILVAMCVMALLFAAAVLAIFGKAGWFELPHIEGRTSDPNVVLELALLVSGRIVVVVAFGWVIVFLGTLHARHAQQAVWYQARAAGLDAAKMIIQYGTPAGREDTLRRMARTYLGDEVNAFREPSRVRNYTGPELKKTAKDFVTVMKPLIKGR